MTRHWVGVAIYAIGLVLPGLAASQTADADLRSCVTSAQDRAGAEACMNIVFDNCMAASGDETTAGTAICLSEETDAWDRWLNELWPQISAAAQQADQYEPGSGGATVAALVKAQQSWIAFRDAECAYQYQRYAGGTIRSIIGASCMLELTADRVLDFRDWLSEGG